ncbi:MAG TPA: hypothetical protein VGX00_02135 [Thermoplasmata archaeon]|nr:hypothetical protein [Thermoplasmata archaeon]
MAADKKVRILLGTRKGSYIVESDTKRKSWKVGPANHAGSDVYHVVADPRYPGTLYAAVNNDFWGPMLHRSKNWGKTWAEIATPMTPLKKDRKPAFNDADPTTPVPRPLNRLWHIEPGPSSEPKTVYLGADPHLLFRSRDLGTSWDPIDAINEHPARKGWSPGAGGACLHTIIVDPRDPRQLYIGMSSVGTFRSDDAGASWIPTNRGVETPFLPEKFPETGQCVHHVAQDAANPDTFYRQDHAGVYISRNRMDSWVRVGKPLGDDFGFGVAAPSSRPGTAYFVRLDGQARVTGEGHLQVWEWNEGSKRWRKLLGPKAFPGHFGVQREGIAADSLDPPGIYVGTTTGQLIVSPDSGKSWHEVPFTFPSIHSVSVSSPRAK